MSHEPANHIKALVQRVLMKVLEDHPDGFEIDGVEPGHSAQFDVMGGSGRFTYGAFYDNKQTFSFSIAKAGMYVTADHLDRVITFLLETGMTTMTKVRDAALRKTSVHDSLTGTIRDRFLFIVNNPQYKIKMSRALCFDGRDADEAETMRVMGMK